jgi:beta-lactamase regulating signal transducer with metallopeptidase domain
MIDAITVLILLGKAGLILGAAWLLQRLTARASAAVRHGVWTVSLITVLFLPTAPLWLPPLDIPLPALPARLPATPPGSPASAGAASEVGVLRPGAGEPPPTTAAAQVGDDRADEAGDANPVRWGALLLAVWVAGVILRLAWLAAQLARVHWLIGYARPPANRARTRLANRLATRLSIVRSVRLLESDRVSMPLTWGAARPVVVLPRETSGWPLERLHVVLLHELAHVRRWDYVTALLAEIASALYWPLPLVWLARRRVHTEQEQACDDLVLQAGTGSIEYAEHLLAIARAFSGNQWEFGAAITMAREVSLKHRIRAILETRTNRGPLLCVQGLFALALLCGIALPVAALRAEPEPIAPPALAARGVAQLGSLTTIAAAAPAPLRTAPAAMYLWAEAEDAAPPSPARRRASLGASAGAYVVLSDRERSRDGLDEVTFSLDVPRAADYLVWARLAGDRGPDGSLVLSVDDAAPLRWAPGRANRTGLRGWDWHRVEDSGSDASRTVPAGFRLAAGVHTLRVRSDDGSVRFDRLLVTTDSLYRPEARGAPEVGFQPEYRLMEAEGAELRGAIQRARDDLASADGYLTFGAGRGRNGGGSATFNFDVSQPGRYAIWGRVVAPDGRANSFFASVDDGAEVVWDAPARDDDARWWIWDPLSARELDGRTVDPLLFDLQPGRHQLRIRTREPGTRLDAILVTNDLAHRPRGIWPATLPAAPVHLWLEAESARIIEPFAVREDARAGGGKYLEVGKIKAEEKEAGAGAAVLHFSVPQAGVYTLWARTIARDRDEDSFWLRVNGGPRTRWNEIARGRDWRWSTVHDTDRANRIAQFHLRAGANRIELAGRESGVRLDRFLITNDPLFEPGE